MPHISRYKKRTSDRSGFDGFEVGMVKQGGYRVLPDEFDTPPPSKLSMGGEGSISAGQTRDNSRFDLSVAVSTDTASGLGYTTQYLTTASTIQLSATTFPVAFVTGSTQSVVLNSDPQVALGLQGQTLAIQCIDSSVTLVHGNGLNLMGSSNFVMQSGSVITMIYATGGTVWWETSRSR